MLRITRVVNGEAVYRLIGRMGAEDIGELKTLLGAETSGCRIVFDLRDLMLVDQAVVSFLRGCEMDGIEIENCPAYIREWIERERGQNSQQKQ